MINTKLLTRKFKLVSTISGYKYNFLNVIDTDFDNTAVKLGINGDVVEIDGAYFGHNKYHLNGASRRSNKCILGMTERTHPTYNPKPNFYFFMLQVKIEKNLNFLLKNMYLLSEKWL